MIKAVMDVEIPKQCDQCPFCYWEERTEYDILHCNIAKGNLKEVHLQTREKPDWCPLKDIATGKEMGRCCVLGWLNEVYRHPTVAFNTYSDEQQIEFAHDALVLLKEQEEQINDLQHKLETLTKWRMNAGAFD